MFVKKPKNCNPLSPPSGPAAAAVQGQDPLHDGQGGRRRRDGKVRKLKNSSQYSCD